MESSGFTEMVMKMKPSRFEDVIAAGALYRPGPLDQKLDDGRTMVDVYIDRKHGREKVTYPHPKLEPILCDTYGVIVYQEQVMQISQVLAGYSLGRADLLRRAMGKKKAEVMAKERTGFMEGCAQGGVDEQVAAGIFDLMEKFAAYGFNKSPLGRLRPAHRADGLAQGALPGRVHGRAHLQRGLQHRQGGGPHRRRRARAASRCSSPTSTSSETAFTRAALAGRARPGGASASASAR